ncbi:MAG: trypsin-like peptidase domain-containing protein [Planctomycetaceae bacterium]|nr:trypsin-like peptidase domain-containing protein [Planctomycetaceae bacterium]
MRVFSVVLGLWLGVCGVIRAEETVHDAIDSVQPKLVKLFGAGGFKNLAGYGTGYLVSSDGHIVTVWSHLLDADVVTVVLHDGRRFFGKVVGTDARKDVAVLKIEAEECPHFDLAKTGQVGPGASVLAYSNMFKVASGDEPMTVMHGVVSAKTDLDARRGRYEVPYTGPVYILDAVTNNPGAAGGVVTTFDGKLLAMLGRQVKFSGSNTWLNYAMPIDELRPSIEAILSGKSRPDDSLTTPEENGSDFSPLDFGIVLVPDVVRRTPAYVETVVTDSQASQLGLEPDDLIVFANGELISSIRTLQDVLKRLTPGDDLQLTVRRGDALVTVTFRVPREK